MFLWELRQTRALSAILPTTSTATVRFNRRRFCRENDVYDLDSIFSLFALAVRSIKKRKAVSFHCLQVKSTESLQQRCVEGDHFCFAIRDGFESKCRSSAWVSVGRSSSSPP
jgi:hypothetical protein